MQNAFFTSSLVKILALHNLDKISLETGSLKGSLFNAELRGWGSTQVLRKLFLFHYGQSVGSFIGDIPLAVSSFNLFLT